MLAYVFWHQPSPTAAGYEEALAAFHAALRASPTPGLRGSRSVRVPTLPWLPGGGFEDWYYVEDFTSLGLLNGGAAELGQHDTVAHLSAAGAGGLYVLRTGQWWTAGTHHAWSAARPDPGPGALWQRQMVLGPAPEYCVVGDRAGGDVAVGVTSINGT